MTCCDKPAGPLFWCSGCHKNSCPACVMACCDVVPAYVLPVALVEQIAAREQERQEKP